jgi:uncharacterized protein YjiS (DUF1127 family)
MQSIIDFIALAGEPRPRSAWHALLMTLALWHHRHRSRRHLAALDDRELRDVGLTREDRRTECAKPFWQA